MEDTRDRQHSEEGSARSEPEAKQEKKSEKATGNTGEGPSMGKIAGGLAAFLALALYFVWIGNEMGSHAVSGTFEMWAIFGAIFIGVVALIAGGASIRRR